jgi:hypothetical protein
MLRGAANCVGVTCSVGPVRPDARKRHAASSIKVRPPLWFGWCVVCYEAKVSMSSHLQDGKTNVVLVHVCHVSGPVRLASIKAEQFRFDVL